MLWSRRATNLLDGNDLVKKSVRLSADCSGDIRYFNVPEFDELTYVEVTTIDVFGPGVMLRIISEVTRGFVITDERDEKAAAEADLI